MTKQPKSPTPREVFARNVRKTRRLAELSQEQLALSCGLSRAYVSEVERGLRNISIDKMGEIAEALGKALKNLVDPEMYAA